MTTADRFLSVLGLFTSGRPEWTVEGAAKELGLPVSSTYRYFRGLAKAGLIVAFAAGRYVLGPAIIQFDRQIRLTDPLSTSAQPIMKRLSQQAPREAIIMLCRLFRNQVMCVHQESPGHPDYAISYERGRPVPLFRGAPSKSILAHLSPRTIKTFHTKHAEEMAQAGLGSDWEQVKRRLRELRQAAVIISQSELDPGMTGISVPVFEPDGAVIGSLSMVMPVNSRTPLIVADATQLLRAASEEIAWALSILADGHHSATEDKQQPATKRNKSVRQRIRTKRMRGLPLAAAKKRAKPRLSVRKNRIRH